MTDCPVCEARDIQVNGNGAGDTTQFDCPRCGQFWLTGTATVVLPERLGSSALKRSLMSHALRRMGPTEKVIGSAELDSFWSEETLPTASKQADDLILYAGDKQLAPDRHVKASNQFLSAWVGAAISKVDASQGLHWLLNYLAKTDLLENREDRNDGAAPAIVMRLTMSGWSRYGELKQQRREGRTAFMAMKFGDAALDDLVESIFRPAVARTDFLLRKLTDGQPAGSIDNQIRAAILSGRFVIADLTHANLGAYWEAGFAEGVGLPVIYTCEKSVWDREKTHFDTNHLMTIIWDRAEPRAAGIALTATKSDFPI